MSKNYLEMILNKWKVPEEFIKNYDEKIVLSITFSTGNNEN